MIPPEQIAAINTTKAVILEIVSASPEPMRATDLWNALEQRGLSEDMGRACVWFLVDGGQLEFTPERRLKVRQA